MDSNLDARRRSFVKGRSGRFEARQKLERERKRERERERVISSIRSSREPFKILHTMHTNANKETFELRSARFSPSTLTQCICIRFNSTRLPEDDATCISELANYNRLFRDIRIARCNNRFSKGRREREREINIYIWTSSRRHLFTL